MNTGINVKKIQPMEIYEPLTATDPVLTTYLETGKM